MKAVDSELIELKPQACTGSNCRRLAARKIVGDAAGLAQQRGRCMPIARALFKNVDHRNKSLNLLLI